MSKKQKIIFILWSILTLTITFTTYSITEKDKKNLDSIKIFSLMIGGYGVIATILHNSESIRINNKKIQEKMKYDKIENTFKLLQDWDNPHLFEARKFTRLIGDERSKISDEELVKKIIEDADLRQSIILVFNYFEHIRVSIKYERIDKEIFKNSLGQLVIGIIERFRPYAKKLGKQHDIDMEELRKMLV